MSTPAKYVGNIITAKAAGSIDQGDFVKITTSTSPDVSVVVATSSSDNILGIAIQGAVSGDPVGILIDGYGELVVDGSGTAIAAGDGLVPTTGGVGVKVSAGAIAHWRAIDSCSTASGSKIAVVRSPNFASIPMATAADISGATGTVTITAPITTSTASRNGTAAIAIPAASATPGFVLILKKTGTAGAITYTPASGTINGASSFSTMDAQNDSAIFVAIGTDWVLMVSTIA